MTSGTIVEISIPADEFLLGQTLVATEGVTVEIERIVGCDGNCTLPLVWIRDDSRTVTEAVLADDSSVERVELIANLNVERLYRVEWADRFDALVRTFVESDGTILAATGSSENWNLRVLFSDRTALSETYRSCRAHGLSLDIQQIHRLKDGRQGRFGLTDEQQEILTLAYKRGYYGVPRDVSASELADDLGISHQAVSERLRRGHDKLVKKGLLLDHGSDH